MAKKREDVWERHVAAARTMTGAECAAQVRALALDPRFAAVLALIEGHREGFVEAGSAQMMAGDAGKQSHCWGSIHALNTLRDALRETVRQPVKRGEETVETEG